MQSADCILSPMQSADCAGSQIACNIYTGNYQTTIRTTNREHQPLEFSSEPSLVKSDKGGKFEC